MVFPVVKYEWESEVKSEVAQLCLTLCDLMDCSPPGSFVHGVFQARTLEWVAISFSNITFIYYVIHIKHLRAIKILDIVYVQWFYFISKDTLDQRREVTYPMTFNMWQFRLEYKTAYLHQFSSVQFSCSVVSDSLQPHGLQHARPPYSSPIPGVYSNSCPSSLWCHPTISSSVITLLCLHSIFSSIRVFSNESALHIRWPKYWSFSFSISLSNEHSGLISFRIGWLDLLAVQGTLKSLLQHHSSKASILWYSAYFIAQLSHPYMTTGNTVALTRQTLLAK